MAAPPSRSLSPSTSPRLPSPPPFPEVQIGPKSPTVRPAGQPGNDTYETIVSDHGPTRRIRPGTKASDMASGPPLVPLADLDSPFQLQEHLKALYFQATKSEHSNSTIPINRETAYKITSPPANVDRFLWLYELCRFLVQRTNHLIVGFFSDTPPCSAQHCPEMRASEWQYLCAVHDPPKSCSAIDYCCHTLDWASNILTSPKHFPSRLTLGSEAAGGSQQGVRQLTNIFRRVYRMFAHAWFQHREVFWNVENHEGLYIFYKTVCDVYSLIPQENYTIPIEAEGLASEPDYSPREAGQIPVDLSSSTRYGTIAEVPKQQEDGDTSATQSTGATTRRHKHTPSTGSFVTTIAEGDEDSHETPVTSIPSVDVVSTEPPSENEKYNATNTSAEPRAFANQQGEDDQLKEDAVSSLTNDVKVLEIDGKGASTEQSAPETSVAESAGERKQDSAVMTAVPKE